MAWWLARAIQQVGKSSGCISTQPSTCLVLRRIDLAKPQRHKGVTWSWVPSSATVAPAIAPDIALEGRCFVLTACQFIRKQAFPASVRVSLGDAPDAVLMRGGSAIINPLGKVLAGPNFEGETILTADLDLHDIGRGKFDFDVTGHYSRPDIFQLIVNEAPTPAVVTKTGE